MLFRPEDPHVWIKPAQLWASHDLVYTAGVFGVALCQCGCSHNHRYSYDYSYSAWCVLGMGMINR